jgi:hypothetical protein
LPSVPMPIPGIVYFPTSSFSMRAACFDYKLHTDHAVIASRLREAIPMRSFATKDDVASGAWQSPRPLCCGLATTSWKDMLFQ